MGVCCWSGNDDQPLPQRLCPKSWQLQELEDARIETSAWSCWCHFCHAWDPVASCEHAVQDLCKAPITKQPVNKAEIPRFKRCEINERPQTQTHASEAKHAA